MSRTHRYEVSCVWTGDRGDGTADYRAYDRSYETTSSGRPTLEGSSDAAFRGDAERWNPELLLVAALSQCHLLSYLHRCAVGGVTVTGYSDTAEGVMTENADDGGRFAEVVLRPVVTVANESMVERAGQLHADAAAHCFIASSVNFPVRHQPRIIVGDDAAAAWPAVARAGVPGRDSVASLPALLQSPSGADMTVLLAEDVRFHSPAADYEGREDVAHLVTAISTVLEDVCATRRLAQGPATTTFFTAAADGHPLDGVLDERFAPDGRLAEATLFLRPYGALRVAIGRMRSALARDPLPSARR